MSSYVEKNLNKGESIICEAKRSLLLLLPWLIFTVILVVAAVIVKQPPIIAMALFFVIIFIISFVKYKRSKLTLTSSRLIFRRGIFNTKSVDIFYEQIETVVIAQKLLGKLFHYSTISVSTGGLSSCELSGVVDADKLKNTIMLQVDERKRAAAEEQAKMQAQAMRDAFAAMQSSSNTDK